MEIRYFTHKGHAGDIIYSLPTIIAYRADGIGCILVPKREWDYDVLYRLLKLQPYINDVKKLSEVGHLYSNEWISLNYYGYYAKKDRFKHLVLCHLEPSGKTFDLSKPWLENIKPNHVADIIVSRSLDYHDKQEVDWTLLRPFADRCKFIGYKHEFDTFSNLYKCNIEYHPTKDALEIAEVLKGSKILIGNQSLIMAIAEGIKHPRCIEKHYVHPCAGNCNPNNNDGYYTCLTEDIIKRYL